MKNKYTQTDESCFDKSNLISDECLNEILKEYCVKQKFPNCETTIPSSNSNENVSVFKKSAYSGTKGKFSAADYLQSFGDWKIGNPIRHNGLIFSKFYCYSFRIEWTYCPHEQTSFTFDKQDRNNDSPRLERVSSDMTKDDIIENMLFPSKWNLPRFLVIFQIHTFFHKKC
uniref:Uncharacterized protein n=1 Tax=Meloidogyne enterolobii TaxID=390850 RepID=A0A6V7WPD7_MELEN|nr:unnamed protein product [Meloidogyne enterolobii]